MEIDVEQLEAISECLWCFTYVRDNYSEIIQPSYSCFEGFGVD